MDIERSVRLMKQLTFDDLIDLLDKHNINYSKRFYVLYLELGITSNIAIDIYDNTIHSDGGIKGLTFKQLIRKIKNNKIKQWRF